MTYGQMKCKFKLFTSQQLFDLHRYWRAHQAPNIINRSHIYLLLTANNTHTLKH